MKRSLLLLGTFLTLAGVSNAQKLALYEEFSGENCAPCAALNPALMTLINANPSKVLLLKYQSPIPSAGSIYLTNTVFTDNRMNYYSVPFAPYGRINGKVVGTGSNAGNISMTTQAIIDGAAAEASNFSIAVSNPTYNADGQTFTATVTVTANAANTTNNLKLRFALAEELQYATAPGSNGETHFQNVVRQMYPNADGQTVDAAWTAGQVRTYTVTGSIPSYVSATAPTRMFVAFLQNETTKEVLQAGKTGNITITKPAADASITAVTIPSDLTCQLPTSLNNVTTTIKNTGTAALTTATVYYRVGTGAWQTATWNGNLAAGATANFTLPAISVTTPGQIAIQDSIALPNTKIDLNAYDNSGSGVITVLDPAAVNIPLSYDMEAVNPAWVSYASADKAPMVRAWSGSSSQPLGYNNSTYFLYYPAPYTDAGDVGFYIFPKTTLPAGAKAVDFYLSYAMRATVGDKLELVYSTNCGTSWTSVWSAQQANLATTTPTASNTLHLPTAATWKLRSIDISSVPTDAYLAFRATSGGGNYIFVDNINVRTGEPTAIGDVVAENSIKVYPNPVVNELNVEMEMTKATKVTFTVMNALGQEVMAPVAQNMSNGVQSTKLDVTALPAGIYFLNIVTPNGKTQQKFVKK
jgi:hypothetical protein